MPRCAQGIGGWRGLGELRLIDSPLIVVGAPTAAHRLLGRDETALSEQPLIGEATLWAQWFAAGGITARPRRWRTSTTRA